MFVAAGGTRGKCQDHRQQQEATKCILPQARNTPDAGRGVDHLQSGCWTLARQISLRVNVLFRDLVRSFLLLSTVLLAVLLVVHVASMRKEGTDWTSTWVIWTRLISWSVILEPVLSLHMAQCLFHF